MQFQTWLSKPETFQLFMLVLAERKLQADTLKQTLKFLKQVEVEFE